MRATSAHASTFTRIAAVAVATLALGGCMSVSDAGRPAPAGTGKQRETGTQPDGGLQLPGSRPGRTDAKSVKGGASGSPAAKGGRSESASAAPSTAPGASPPAGRPGKPGAQSKPPGGGPGTS
ncbi:hypothetical protein LE181_31885, partial [Streptomyces sp. SCA3-4]|nr:hypothetical protein [Streptomyces sichuanensis]